MPIFVSRFSAERIASSDLQRTRNNRQAENRASARSERNDRAERGEQTGRGRGSQRGERAQDQLPVATQTAEFIREELESRRTGGSRGESAGESQADEQRRQSLAEPPTWNADPSASDNARSAEVRQAFRDIPSEAQGFAGVQALRLNAQVDASIRLQRSNQGEQGNANGVDRGNPAGAETGREIPPPTVGETHTPSVSLVAESTTFTFPDR